MNQHDALNGLINEVNFYGITSLSKKIDCFRYPIEELDENDRKIRSNEMILRHLYSFDRANPILDDPFISLISVFDNLHAFFPVEQLDTKDLLFLHHGAEFSKPPCIVSGKAEFDEQWAIMTSGILDGLNWEGVLAAGGSVLASSRCYFVKNVGSIIRMSDLVISTCFYTV